MSSSNGGTRLRIGLVGAGAIARIAHLPALAAVDGAVIAGICDPSLKRGGELARQYGGEAYQDVESLISNAHLDGVVVCCPNAHHEAAVAAAASHGLAVFCQKPLAHDLASAQRMVDACDQAGVILQVGFNQRYWPAVQRAHEIIDAEIIGSPRIFRSVYSEAWNVYPAATEYRYDLEQSGGASIIDLAVHRIDLARFLLGEITEVCAVIAHTTLPVPVDDTVNLTVRFESGAVGTITSDRFSPQVSNATDVFGSEGTLHVSTETINPFQSVPLAVSTRRDFDSLPQWLQDSFYPTAWWEDYVPGQWLTAIPPRTSAFQREMQAFCDAIRKGTAPPVTGHDGLKAQEVVTAAYRSERLHSWVSLPLREQSEPVPVYAARA